VLPPCGYNVLAFGTPWQPLRVFGDAEFFAFLVASESQTFWNVMDIAGGFLNVPTWEGVLLALLPCGCTLSPGALRGCRSLLFARTVGGRYHTLTSIW
jgi:hypothetical protein